MALLPALRVQPPANELPVAADGQHSKPWADYHQSVADRLAALPGQVRKGVTDGSDAAAGDIGEYQEASFAGPVALSNGVAGDIGSLSLTAGDWDVSGAVSLLGSLANMVNAQCWVGLVSATAADPGRAGLAVGAGGNVAFWRGWVGPVRLSLAATTTVYLGALAGFPAGGVSGSGTISARRVR